jgi:ribulose bisphosphate carboxylase small subunit
MGWDQTSNILTSTVRLETTFERTSIKAIVENILPQGWSIEYEHECHDAMRVSTLLSSGSIMQALDTIADMMNWRVFVSDETLSVKFARKMEFY